MNAGPSGFKGASVSKGLLIATLSSSILVQAAKSSRRRVPLLVAIFNQMFTFRHPGELIFGTALLYYTRLYERQYGSGKYGSFVVASCSISYVLETLAASVVGLPSSSGPYPLIFATLINFVLDVPPLYNLQVFGWRATDKSFIYVAAAQLLFSSPRRSLVAAVCGLVAGGVYRANLFGMQSWRLPLVITELFSNTLGRVLQAPPPPLLPPQQQEAAAAAAAAGGARGGGPPSGAAAAAVAGGGVRGGGPHTRPLGVPPPLGQMGGGRVDPSPEAVAQLVAMGFPEEQARDALARSSNSVELALQHLL